MRLQDGVATVKFATAEVGQGFVTLAQQIARNDPAAAVSCAYLELCEPDMASAARRMVEVGEHLVGEGELVLDAAAGPTPDQRGVGPLGLSLGGLGRRVVALGKGLLEETRRRKLLRISGDDHALDRVLAAATKIRASADSARAAAQPRAAAAPDAERAYGVRVVREPRRQEEQVALLERTWQRDVNARRAEVREAEAVADVLGEHRARGVEHEHHVGRARRRGDGLWRIRTRNAVGNTPGSFDARFVFVGAGGGALSLLQKSGIPEVEGYGGFPVSGDFLRTTNPKIVAKHKAKVYGKELAGEMDHDDVAEAQRQARQWLAQG